MSGIGVHKSLDVRPSKTSKIKGLDLFGVGGNQRQGAGGNTWAVHNVYNQRGSFCAFEKSFHIDLAL